MLDRQRFNLYYSLPIRNYIPSLWAESFVQYHGHHRMLKTIAAHSRLLRYKRSISFSSLVLPLIIHKFSIDSTQKQLTT